MYGGKAAGGYPLHHGGAYGYEAHGKASKTGFAGGYNHKAYDYESESDSDESDSDESDCEEAFPPRGPTKQGGVHGYAAAYQHEKHGAGSNLGGVRRYESYGRHEEVGGRRRYESYQSTTKEYTGAGGGYGYGTCSPLSYGA